MPYLIVMFGVGTEFGDYLVEAALGEGAMAMVYRVRHKPFNAHYALKHLKSTQGGQRDRILREGSIQAQIRHPNVVHVSQLYQIDGRPGLLMEYADAWSLDRYIGGAPWRPEDVERLFRQVLEGVERAHQHGVVHRDLKPANILMTTTREGFLPKVGDFGLARLLTDTVGSRAGMLLGSAAYMAPEQTFDASTADTRADLFSMGCILYELLTARLPFEGEDTYDVIDRVRALEYRHLGDEVPANLRSAVEACLVKDRRERVASCEDLRRVLGGPRRSRLPVLNEENKAPPRATNTMNLDDIRQTVNGRFLPLQSRETQVPLAEELLPEEMPPDDLPPETTLDRFDSDPFGEEPGANSLPKVVPPGKIRKDPRISALRDPSETESIPEPIALPPVRETWTFPRLGAAAIALAAIFTVIVIATGYEDFFRALAGTVTPPPRMVTRPPRAMTEAVVTPPAQAEEYLFFQEVPPDLFLPDELAGAGGTTSGSTDVPAPDDPKPTPHGGPKKDDTIRKPPPVNDVAVVAVPPTPVEVKFKYAPGTHFYNVSIDGKAPFTTYHMVPLLPGSYEIVVTYGEGHDTTFSYQETLVVPESATAVTWCWNPVRNQRC